jgi:hypothetical protein
MSRDLRTRGHDHHHGHDRHHRHELGDTPVLDIGGDVGAMVVYLPEDPLSGELDACPHGKPGDRFHTGVHELDIADGPTWVAVYPEVPAGRYDLLADTGDVLATVAVAGGDVTLHDLR